MIMNVIVGIVGSMLAGGLSGRFWVPNGNQNDFSFAGLLVPFLCAVNLLAIVNFFTRGRTRP
jgi:uncharacterized membrane protein YeaQ/YmgE (transglycosylase-associated protein family)